MRSIIIIFVLALCASCTKTKKEFIVITKTDTVNTVTTKQPRVISAASANFYDTVNFTFDQNITFTQRDTIKQINIFCNPDKAIVGTVQNIYVLTHLGTKVDVFCVGNGQCYKLNSVPESGLEWYLRIEYMGNFNGINIFNVETHRW